MGAIIVLIASFVASFTFSGISHVQTNFLKLQTGRVLSTNHTYEPPDRKSIMIDIDGMDHLTADNTRPTRRDRSKKVVISPIAANVTMEKKKVESTMPLVSAAELQKPPAPMEIKTLNIQEPVRQYQIEEAPLITPSIPKKISPPPVLKTKTAAIKRSTKSSLGRKVKTAILRNHGVSRSAKLALTVTSGHGKVTLRGVVLSKREKDRIGAIAGKFVNPNKVNNQLIIVKR